MKTVGETFPGYYEPRAVERMKEKIREFVKRVETESNIDLNRSYPKFSNGDADAYDPSKVFTVKFGRKYAKIIARDTNNSGGSVWGFVNMENGDLLKAASWKAPAKHARGNIASAAYGRNYVWTGPNYLRNY